MRVPPSSELVRSQLDRVLASAVFVRAERISRFLRYTVEQTLQGHRERIKESVIGVAVYDRRADYDPKIDPIVRSDVRRLRTKLTEYYEGEGRLDDVLIEYPKGSYAPVFRSRLPEPVPSPAPASRWWKYGGALAAAVALGFAARWVTGDQGAKATRIAVLPFMNLGATPENDHFSDGLTDELMHALTRSGGFDVISQTSSFSLKESSQRFVRLALCSKSGPCSKAACARPEIG